MWLPNSRCPRIYASDAATARSVSDGSARSQVMRVRSAEQRHEDACDRELTISSDLRETRGAGAAPTGFEIQSATEASCAAAARGAVDCAVAKPIQFAPAPIVFRNFFNTIHWLAA